ncbi:F-box protein [Acorus calamus]|uniref:F-box protein n=1 Tax=Acorus calamus TaxID=4465 RepID=A0AAV9EK70_ACOCL|nr:F-box protein [Acorus calamus]
MAPSLPKRPCCGGGGGDSVAASTSASDAPPPDPIDRLLEHLITLSDASPSPDLSFSLSLDRILGSAASEAEEGLAIDRVLRLGSAIVDAGTRAARRRASRHNSASWPLAPDLTIKVFSMLDTQSLCHAAATCSMFNKCAADPLCYANIDLTSAVPKVNNTVVGTMIQRAGKNLQSLKLGILPCPTLSTGPSRPMAYSIGNAFDTSVLSWNDKRSRKGRDSSSVLTRACLQTLDGVAGALLRSLHLYNIDRMDSTPLCVALSACKSLLDLEIIGLHVELKQILDSISANCHLLERLFFESSKSDRDDSLNTSTCVDLVSGCPHLTSLSLRGFKLHDNKIRVLVKGFRSLKFIDFSSSYATTGAFLRSVGNGGSCPSLEVLILRDCLHLKEAEVSRFLFAVLAGDCKLLRYLDISNCYGLAAEEDWYDRCNGQSIPISRILEERPNLHLVAEFRRREVSSRMNE